LILRALVDGQKKHCCLLTAPLTRMAVSIVKLPNFPIFWDRFSRYIHCS